MADTLDPLFTRLTRSKFRSRFKLGLAEQRYVQTHSTDDLNAHALRFITERLAPAHPVNDGKQTPMRGHPVFIAQHATATCCRSCLSKWHAIGAGRALSDKEVAYVVEVIAAWIARQAVPPLPEAELTLFDAE